MSTQGDTDLHFWLTRSVGRSIGLNFMAAMEQGRLSADGYRELVLSCQACPHVSSCQLWLARQHNPPQEARAPEFCRIAPELEALRPSDRTCRGMC